MQGIAWDWLPLEFMNPLTSRQSATSAPATSCVLTRLADRPDVVVVGTFYGASYAVRAVP
jgi:hypothetical protein